jgi:hypothetical protein
MSCAPELRPGTPPDGLPPEFRNLSLLRDAIEERPGLEPKPAKVPISD